MDINATLIDKGIVLPDAPPPAANYIPYVKIGKLVFVSGPVSYTHLTRATKGWV